MGSRWIFFLIQESEELSGNTWIALPCIEIVCCTLYFVRIYLDSCKSGCEKLAQILFELLSLLDNLYEVFKKSIGCVFSWTCLQCHLTVSGVKDVVGKREGLMPDSNLLYCWQPSL